MSVLVAAVGNRVQVVALDDPSPGYAATFARAIKRYMPGDVELRWCEVDVTRVSEDGPDTIAAMLTGEELSTDLPQEWETMR